MIRSLVMLVALGVFAVHATPAQAAGVKSKPARRAPAATHTAQGVGARIAARAGQLIGVQDLHALDASVPDDCTGLVRLAYEGGGINLMDGGKGSQGDNGVMILYRRARTLGALHKQPKPGDIVFFRETYDRNHDGLRDDGLTHVGIVEQVAAGGEITIVHRGSRGVARTHMNLSRPTVHREKRGAVVNDYLRRASGTQRAYLTGELFAGFASPEPWARVARRARPLR